MSDSGQLDVLAIGDVVTDAFIKLLDDRAVTYDNDQGKWLAMPLPPRYHSTTPL